MIRVEIELTEEQNRDVERWGERLGLTVADAVLRCVMDRMTAVRVAEGRASHDTPYWRLTRNVR